MARLEGIIYRAFDSYIVLRGFAPIGELAQISYKPQAYQRQANESHKKALMRFLEGGQYKYFPEIILACRANRYDEFWRSIGFEDAVDADDAEFVNGLKVLREKLPTSFESYRARHAYLTMTEKKLVRIDGNHRLESFDEKEDWWGDFFCIDKTPRDVAPQDNAKLSEYAKWRIKEIAEKKKKIAEIIVPFTIIFSHEEDGNKFEAGIFNNINFKQLPLKQEKNIENVYNYLKETNELGDAHELTMKLINLVEANHFKGLGHLTKLGNDEDVFRTACFKIAKTLIGKKNELNESNKIDFFRQKINDIDTQIEEYKQILDKKYILKNNKGRTLKKEEIEKNKKDIIEIQRNIEKCNRTKNRFKKEIKVISSFIEQAEDIYVIEIAIQSLRETYAKMDDNCIGNLSMLASLVYYKLFDQSKFSSFVDWIMRNGIHKIPVNDYLPTHNANSLIALFERIYEAKAKEIFISMQFGDPQSEMIFEKVIQTVEKFNRMKGLDIAITPIRIDQTVMSHSFTIPEEILRAIDGSSLIIADLSSCNINVYHEIGYAMGVAKAKGIEPPLILLYKTDTVYNGQNKDTDKFIGFNLRDTNQLRFSTYKELTDQLTERLEVHFEI